MAGRPLRRARLAQQALREELERSNPDQLAAFDAGMMEPDQTTKALVDSFAQTGREAFDKAMGAELASSKPERVSKTPIGDDTPDRSAKREANAKARAVAIQTIKDTLPTAEQLVASLANAPKMGRPSKYTPQLAAEICRRIALGQTILDICETEGMPTWPTIVDWRLRFPDFATLYFQARQSSADIFETIALRTAERATFLDYGAKRLYVDTLKWAAAKRQPKVYGDRSEMVVSGDVDNPVVVQHHAALRADLIRKLEAMAIPQPLTIEHEDDKA